MSTEKITIRAFRAVDDKAGCAEYLREHIRVLDDIGVTSIIAPDFEWCRDPNVVVIVAQHSELGMVAGMRLHHGLFDLELPLEKFLKKLDPSVPAEISALQPDLKSEIAGLWNAHRFAGRGIPLLLISAGVALSSQLGAPSLVCVAANYMVPNTTKVGFENIKTIGDKGVFRYPIESISSTAMVVRDLLTLTNANGTERHRILSLRLRPKQVRYEQQKDKELLVYYELHVLGIDLGLSAEATSVNKAA